MTRRLVTCGAVVAVLVAGGLVARLATQNSPSGIGGYPVLTQEAWEQMFEEVSNWGRWGPDDERGTYNLLTPEKAKQAAALVKEGRWVSMEHALIETADPDVHTPFQKSNKGNKFVWNTVHGGTFHSHIDALCHIDYKGLVYNGLVRAEIEDEDGCHKLGIEHWKDGFVTRGVLIDMPRFKGVPWLEPGTPVTLKDIEAWEEETGIEVLPGDAVLLRTGKWARRAALGPWEVGSAGPDAGYHWSVIPWFKARDVAIIGDDGPNDVRPPGAEESVGLPVHTAILAALGAIILDGQDLEGVADLAAELNRWEFMLTGAPLNVVGGGGSSINVLATF
jgi:kynurenine formamidase